MLSVGNMCNIHTCVLLSVLQFTTVHLIKTIISNIFRGANCTTKTSMPELHVSILRFYVYTLYYNT